MKKLVLFAPVLFIMNGTSQNLIQNASFLNISNISQVQSQQAFASNVMVNNNSANRPAVINSNPQAQRMASNSQRRQRRTNTSVNNTAPNPMVQQRNVSIDNINDNIQIQSNVIAIENNSGNAFGNEMDPLAQIPSLDIPAIPSGNGNMNLNVNLDINMPKINLRSVKLSGKGASDSKGSNHALLNLKKKLAKFNRKAAGKLSFKRKLKIKVDDCFNW